MAVNRSREELTEDQPLSDLQKTMLQKILLDWLTVWEIGALVKLAGPAPWRFAAMEYGIDRISIFAEQVADQLGIDLDPQSE